MSKPTKLSVSDFPIAPRRPKSGAPETAGETSPASEQAPKAGVPPQTAAAATDTGSTKVRPRRTLPNPSSEERKTKANERALAQEEGRYRLRDLKRAHAREAKHYVNCPLDYDTKMRLQKAAFENDLKMTVIIKAAIDQYLRDNGY